MDLALPIRRQFSAELRAASRTAHRRAEQSGYLDALVNGRLHLDGYAAMVAQHHSIYTVLEAAGRAMRDDPLAGPFVDDGLARLDAIEADLRALCGSGWADRITQTPATIRYVQRLRAVCFDWPGGFIAHHYTRYLGDLSGGRYIADAVRRVYGLPGDRGTAFYTFDRIGDPSAFKQGYRQRLDLVDWAPGERDRVVDEVLLAYRLNSEVLADLGRGAGVALPRSQGG